MYDAASSVAPKLEALAEALGRGARRGVSLAPYTSIRVGGPAELLIASETNDELAHAVQLARVHRVPWRILGRGCNVLVADRGLAGLTIINRAQGVSLEGCRVQVASGVKLSTLAQSMVALGLDGLTWAVGLPGTVGGAVVGNAGAFGSDIAGTLHCATLLQPDGEIVQRDNAWFNFGYRDSRLKGGGGKDTAVLQATFLLKLGSGPELEARAREVMEERRRRHPSGFTMGSTFKNPPGSAAGQLIEQAGLKGHKVGGVSVSEQHGNFLINDGSASAKDVLTLIEHIQTVVERRSGVALTLEIELLGW